MVTFFRDAKALRAWFTKYGKSETELIAGFYKISTGLASVTWSESVDEALCVGWIDGVRKNIDAEAYQIRFTPRKPTSHWSAINIAKVDALIAQGRMKPAGLVAFALRTEEKSRRAAYEQPDMPVLPPEFEALFRKHKAAWKFFEAQAPGYRKTALWRIVSAKREETREKRLLALLEASAQGERW
ncbi:MAG: YdeI/OmpD-associated family protein [Rhodoferax sp.]|nr:YdeI/OmpD-associated family protein [Rhodoferax sp.]